MRFLKTLLSLYPKPPDCCGKADFPDKLWKCMHPKELYHIFPLFHQDIHNFNVYSVFWHPLPISQHNIVVIFYKTSEEFLHTSLTKIDFCLIFIYKIIHFPKTSCTPRWLYYRKKRPPAEVSIVLQFIPFALYSGIQLSNRLFYTFQKSPDQFGRFRRIQNAIRNRVFPFYRDHF